MKSVAWISALLLTTIACEKAPSKLDSLAPAGGMPKGDTDARLARIEKMLAQREEAFQFLDMAYDQTVEQQTKPQPGTVYGVDVAPSLAIGHVAGAADALVTIVEAWDFACPHCYRSAGVLDELLNEYPGKIRVVFKHMVVHPQQVAKAHLALCASAKQGKFKEFYRAFWDKGYKEYQDKRDQSFLGEENVYKIAGELGLDVDKLKSDMPACQQVIAADEAELRKFKVSGTPAFFINGEFIGGGIPKEAFKQYIDQKLAIAEKSGVSGADYYEKEIRGKGEKSVQRRGKGGAPAERAGHDGHGH